MQGCWYFLVESVALYGHLLTLAVLHLLKRSQPHKPHSWLFKSLGEHGSGGSQKGHAVLW